MLIDFARQYLNIERLFRPAGATHTAVRSLHDNVQPIAELARHFVFEPGQLRVSKIKTVNVPAGDTSHNLPEPDKGTFIVPLVLAVSHDSAAARSVDWSLDTTANPADPWGRWENLTIADTLLRVSVPGGSIDAAVLLPTPPPYARGNLMRVTFRAMVLNDDIQSLMMYLQLGAELVQYSDFRPVQVNQRN